MENGREKNAQRFTGFAGIYENARPAVPQYPIDRICAYLGKAPEKVADIGCGTGLSTMVWERVCPDVVGIEPSEDMISVARQKENDKVHFIKAFSDETGLDDESVDVVVCSQSFHWMEPTATLREANRILRKGGMFATIDCDWPPVADWRAEKAYSDFYGEVKRIEAETPGINDTFVKYDKNMHFKNIAQSGYFRYARELLFCSGENCDADRFINIVVSQGSLQAILKRAPELIEKQLDEFKNIIYDIYGDRRFDIEFCYRMRIGIK